MGFNFIKNSFLSLWPALTIGCVSLICIRIAYCRNHKNTFHFHTEFWMLISAVYLLLLYGMLTRVDLNNYVGYNLVPFKEILRYGIKSKQFFYLVLGNVAIFVPFGFMIASYAKPKNIGANFLIGAIVSTTIEFVQRRIGRCFDIDDIILNTIGCMLGYIIYKLFDKIANHLPKFLRSDWFKNLICIIITICIVIYLMKVMAII